MFLQGNITSPISQLKICVIKRFNELESGITRVGFGTGIWVNTLYHQIESIQWCFNCGSAVSLCLHRHEVMETSLQNCCFLWLYHREESWTQKASETYLRSHSFSDEIESKCRQWASEIHDLRTLPIWHRQCGLQLEHSHSEVQGGKNSSRHYEESLLGY